MNVIEWIGLDLFNDIPRSHMPYDTGYMYMNGFRVTETPDFIKGTYDLTAVPYIFYQEEGTKYFTGNVGFIRDDTMAALNSAVVAKAAGVPTNYNKYQDAARKRASMVSSGVLEHIKKHGQKGGNYDAYVG